MHERKGNKYHLKKIQKNERGRKVATNPRSKKEIQKNEKGSKVAAVQGARGCGRGSGGSCCRKEEE